eukprot:CAMPEP_0116846382 /NCGR_PEP_ID=MMETSP0418-20121206/13798_1 /TAXON_ID=1158023 /ORGANISM="Astrosyne radiata, Strain 13vi08-1A" /LENGTH=123 /DNA_ID=CAMNT_0004477611 /DNA_START=204 /DNA_END=575 /DNA_ORIENTATION=-
MPKPQSAEAELFGGHPKGDDSWRMSIYLTYAVSAIMIGVGVMAAPDTSIQSWAEAEARARLALQEEGGLSKLDFGTHYNVTGFKYDFESLKPDNPFNEEDDDDDDDDDDGEDEEGEDEDEEED